MPDKSIKPVPLMQRHPSMGWVVLRFQLAIDAYREMLNEGIQDIELLDERRLGANALAAVKTLPEANRQKLEAFLEHHADPETPSIDPEDSAVQKEVAAIFRGDRYAALSFLLGAREAMAGPRRAAIVRNSLLVMAISAFEVLLTGLISRRFVEYPDAMQADQKEFSLEDVRGFRSEEDAIDLLLSRRVTKIMYGSLDEWSKWFDERANAAFPPLAIDWDGLREAFQRRHVVMHSGGRVSSEYLAKVRAFESLPALGSQLNVNDEYLHRVLDQLDALGTGVAVLAWGTWLPAEREDAARRLLRRTYQTMLMDHWSVTEKLADLSGRVRCADDTAHSIRCNGWLSRAERLGYESIAGEVMPWDASALSARFRLVRHVLLQELEEALALVPSILAAKEIAPGEFREWPILRTLREHPGYAGVAETHQI
ncbi:MAG TPA: hypothetical protein VFR48_02025 [Solirubrobacteraceae bacterium]|nr:hypothetical protein [Solirubrobacteraceae bacterium]